MRALVLLAFVVVTALPTSACGKHLYSKDDLEVSLFQHHNNLRWGRLENAALSVEPAMRPTFLTVWAARMQALELQDVEVVGTAITPDGDGADVVVNITYVDKQSMTVKTVPITEHWTRTDDGWLVSKFADLPAAT